LRWEFSRLAANRIVNQRSVVNLTRMDQIDRKIIGLLGDDARRSLADIGARVSLSPSAVNERIRKLAAGGVIRRYTVDVDPGKLGVPVCAFVFVALRESADEEAFRARVQDMPDIAECHHVTGVWNYLVKVQLADLSALEHFITALKSTGFIAKTETVIALSTVTHAIFSPRGELDDPR